MSRRPAAAGGLPADAPVSDAPAWVTGALGPDLRDVARLPWGFTNESWGATTPAGERYAVTRMASLEAASFVLRVGPEIARRAGEAGVAMPAPIEELSNAAAGVIVSRWLAGASAMDRLSDPEGAAAVGRALGEARARLDAVAIDGLGLDDTWASPSRLADAAGEWLESTAPDLRAPTVAALAGRIRTVGSLEAPARAAFVHGDLVPANLLLRETGDPGAALLDLESARMGDPLLDAAWFHWIVGHHHPELLPQAWAAFAEGAGLDLRSRRLAEVLRAYPALRIVQILAGRGVEAGSRRRWLRQLDAAIGRGEGF